MKNRTLPIIVATVFFLGIASPGFSKPFSRTAALLGASDSVLVQTEDGRVLFFHQADTLRVPASILKVLTSLAALHLLGPDHRFVTEMYADGRGTCALKGYGDPLLVSEVLEDMAQILVQKAPGCTRLILDDGFFANPLEIPGTDSSTNPYDSPVGALCANFNTVNFSRDPQTGELRTAEPQTPLVPFARELIRKNRFPKGRVLLTQDCRQTTLYAGHLFAWFYGQAGGWTIRSVELGQVEPRFTLVHAFESPYDLKENLRRLLEFSNNFMTNQILLAMGAKRFGPPATLEKGVSVLEEFAREKLGLRKLHLAEGSGISRENRISATEMMKVLEAFELYAGLLPEEDGVRFKTGTLNGISSRAGYVRRADKIPCWFVILLNSPGSKAQKVMESVLRELPPQGRGPDRS
ncbi:MAG: D-alanyl-D-alanine carboxypeptidase [Proteobacteria bacterium]|nr:D-alanyl-D-alanine carboxypeptidase [Pseudomonadota bacterium]